MVSQDLQTSITEAVERVLETMCFSAVLGTCDSDEAQSRLDLSAAIDYSGANRGTVLVGCCQAAAQALARNFLGDGQVSEEQVAQLVGELANMICGAVVSGFEGGPALRFRDRGRRSVGSGAGDINTWTRSGCWLSTIPPLFASS
jgi:hypothetical protein